MLWVQVQPAVGGCVSGFWVILSSLGLKHTHTHTHTLAKAWQSDWLIFFEILKVCTQLCGGSRLSVCLSVSESVRSFCKKKKANIQQGRVHLLQTAFKKGKRKHIIHLCTIPSLAINHSTTRKRAVALSSLATSRWRWPTWCSIRVSRQLEAKFKIVDVFGSLACEEKATLQKHIGATNSRLKQRQRYRGLPTQPIIRKKKRKEENP